MVILIPFFFEYRGGKRLKSSPYGPYMLGYTRVTVVETKSYKGVIRSKSLKSTKVRIAL